MKKIGIYLGLLSIMPSSFYTMEIMQDHFSFSSLLFDQRGTPTSALLTVLKKYGICATDRATIVKETQEKFLRKPGTERYQIEGNAPIEQQLAPFKLLNMADTIKPMDHNYEYLLVLGATYNTIKNRIDMLMNLLQNGLRCKQIVFLGSERPLFEHERALSFDGSQPKPETEHQVIQWLYHKQKDLFAKLGHTNLLFINSHNKTDSNGKISRATTQDTVQDFLKVIQRKPESCLVISSQPHAHYQLAVVQKEFLPDFKQIQVAAPAIPADIKEGELLDALARQIYTENIIYETIAPTQSKH